MNASDILRCVIELVIVIPCILLAGGIAIQAMIMNIKSLRQNNEEKVEQTEETNE